ncbi:MAG: HD domain-containing protein [Firmicutes bacterium]|nr:HD domain-containing protein [Bacillota bacterium]
MNPRVTQEKLIILVRGLIIVFLIVMLTWMSKDLKLSLAVQKNLEILVIAAIFYALIPILFVGKLSEEPFHYFCWFVDLIFVTLIFFWLGSKRPEFAFLYYLLIFSGAIGRARITGIGSTIMVAIVYGVVSFINKPASLTVSYPFLNMGALLIMGFLFSYSYPIVQEIASGNLITDDQKDVMLDDALKKSREQALQREKREIDLADKTRKLTTLMQLARFMNTTRRLEELLELIVNKAREEMNSAMGFLLMLREEKELAVVHSQGISEITKKIFNCKVGEGVFGLVAKTGKPTRISEKDNNPLFASFAGALEKIRSILCVPLIDPQDKQPMGVLGVANILVGDSYDQDHENYLNILAIDAAISIKNISLIAELEKAYYEAITALAQAMEAKDPYTSGHIGRVRTYAVKLAESFRMPAEDQEIIAKAAILHDVGKIGTPDRILLKPGQLSTEERAYMNEHVKTSANILRNMSSLPPETIEMVLCHHERYDGTGYPRGLKGDQIPLGAQIIAVADTFDAMTSDRPYRKAFAAEEALAKMKDSSCTQFDPKVLNAFLALFGKEVVEKLELRLNKDLGK